MKGFHKIKIKNLPVAVPLYKDADATERIAQTVEDRLTEIESQSSHHDIIAATFRTAFEFARDHAELKAQWESDNRELVKALERLTSQLKKLVETYRHE